MNIGDKKALEPLIEALRDESRLRNPGAPITATGFCVGISPVVLGLLAVD